jgi:membrane protein
VVLTALQSSLNTILNVRIRADKGFLYFAFSRLVALAMMLVIGFLLIISIVLNAVWIALFDYLNRILPGFSLYLIETGQQIITLGMTTVLFALIYKFLPDASIRWRNIWIGAVTTSVLFLIGRYLISFYLGNTNITSLYGAAGSVILLVVWINYSSWILFLGAEVIMVLSQKRGDRIKPSRIAETYRHVVELDNI